MRTSRRASFLLGAATGLASIGFAFVGATSAQAGGVDRTPTMVQTFTSAGNEAAYWNTLYGVSNCYKVDSPSAWSGSVYVLTSPAAHLIIKAATWNYIWVDASPGSFGTPLSGTGGHAPDGHGISHLIICPAVASTTASPTESTTTATPTESTTTATPTESTTTATPTESTTTATPTVTDTSSDPAVLPSTGGSGSATDTALPIPNTGGGLPHTGGVAVRLLLAMAMALVSIGALAYGSSRKIARTH